MRGALGIVSLLTLSAFGCTPAILGALPSAEETSTGDDGGESDDTDSGGPGVDIKFDVTPEGCGGDLCPNKVDLLFVIDNSGTMGEEQLNLAKNFPALIQELQALENEDGESVGADVNIMVTTTDVGHPLCKFFEKHEPLVGRPVDTGCNARIGHFFPLDDDDPPIPEACTEVCPKDLVPEDQFIHFDSSTGEDNVPNEQPKDINGDGQLDDAVAQTLACIGPQGVDGCGFEAPLEAMMQALNPTSDWNLPDEDEYDSPFLRHDALLAIAIITDEADCSVSDWEIFSPDGPEGTAYWNDKPGVGPATSSAICWNAGVECDAPDMNGHYLGCMSSDQSSMQPITRYTDHLIKNVRETEGKEVVMLGILGVPKVERDDDGKVVGGGVDDLVIRDWEDPEYPQGDILPEDWPDEPAEYKQWLFGVGPGCTGTDEDQKFTGQAIPPVRLVEVCKALDYGDNVRCCIESICDTDFRPALKCLTDIIEDAGKEG